MKAKALIAPIIIVVLLILTLSLIACPTPVLAATQFTITAIQSANGTISPNSASVNQGASKSFNINPNTGYAIASLIVDGSPVTVASSYTFSNVQDNHTITATFAIMNFTLTVTQNVNGDISPETTNINCGESQTFSITPEIGYAIASLNVDGSSVEPTSSYTFINVKADHNITATFTVLKFNITVQQQSNGVISPETVSVNYGTSQTFTITPNTGYSNAFLIVDGLQVPNGSSYAFNNIQADHSISATFALTSTSTPTPTPTPTTPPASTVSPTPLTNIPTSTPISIVPSTSTPTPTSTPPPTKTALSGSANFDFLSWPLLLLVIPSGALAFGIIATKRRKKKQDPKNPVLQLPENNRPKDPEESIDQLFNKTEESVDHLFNKILEEEEHKIENENIPDYEKDEKKKKKYIKVVRARQLLDE